MRHGYVLLSRAEIKARPARRYLHVCAWIADFCGAQRMHHVRPLLSPRAPISFPYPHCFATRTPCFVLGFAALAFAPLPFSHAAVARQTRGTSPSRGRCFRRTRWAASSTCWPGWPCGKRGWTTGMGQATVRETVLYFEVHTCVRFA